jgi:hypothetical protein
MPGELSALLEGLSDAGRRTLTEAFAADRELARGLAIMFGVLPRGVTELLMRRLSVHLGRLGLGEGAFVAALTDVIYERLEEEERREPRRGDRSP